MEAVDRVIAERTLRGWSQREAAAAADEISNQTWSRYEKTGKVTDAIQAAVMQAFDWPATWSTDPPPMPISQPSEVERLVAEHGRRIEELAGLVAQLGEEVAKMGGKLRKPRQRPSTRNEREQGESA